MFHYDMSIKSMQMIFYDQHEMANCIEAMALHLKDKDELEFNIKVIYEEEKDKNENTE